MYVSSGGLSLKLILDNLDFKSEIRFFESYIPDFSFRKNLVVATVSFSKGDMPQIINHSSKEFEIMYTSETGIKDLITLIEHILERKRQERGIYTIHGSVIKKGSKGIIFMGSVSGLGKTSAALYAQNLEDYQLIGDEKILLNSNFNIVGANQRIEINKKELLNFHEKENILQKIDSKEKPFEIFTIIVPIIVESEKDEFYQWEKFKAEFHLYEELSRKIRGTSRRVNHFNVPIASIDSQEVAYKRSQFSKDLSNHINVYLYKGSLESLYKEIDRLIKDS